ncbi:MAG: hypothetical protein R3B72_24270 [Polyangiaceae bacterium]
MTKLPRPLLLTVVLGCAPPAPASSPDPAPTEGVLEVRVPEGALVYVDDELAGVVPFAAAVQAGRREVLVFDEGHAEGYHLLRIVEGRRTILEAQLLPSAQRVAAWSLLATGGAGIAAGTVFGAVASAKIQQGDASGSIDTLTLGAGLAGGLGAASFVVGGALFIFDTPTLPDAPRSREGAGRVGLQLGPGGLLLRGEL